MKSLVMATILVSLIVSAAFCQITTPAKQVVISGTVTDDPFPTKRMDRPLKDVKIKLVAQPIYILNSQPAAILPIYPSQQPIDSAISDAQGIFSLSPQPAGSYQVSFDNPGYVSRSITLYAVHDTAITVALLEAGAKAKVTGTVTTPCAINMNCVRQPVAGCTLTVTRGTLSISPLATTQAALYPVQTPAITAVTGAGGQFSIDSVPLSVNGERVLITFSKSGFTTQSFDTAIWNTMPLSISPSLSKPTVGSRDTVYFTPITPTTRDSLQFTLYNSAHCCGTIYRNNTVTVADTTIMLSYSYDDTLCPFVLCFTAGSSTQFAADPVKAGKYAIYKVESLYCPPGRICLLGILAPVRVGEITVKSATGTRPVADKSLLHSKFGLSIIGKTALITLDKDARISLRAFNLQGAMIAEIASGKKTAGISFVDLNQVFSKMAGGTILLNLSVDGVTDTRVLMR